MRLRIILPLSILILATACESQNKKLIEMESELVQNQGSAQISVYNDDYMDHGKKKNYTYIDTIKDLMNNPDFDVESTEEIRKDTIAEIMNKSYNVTCKKCGKEVYSCSIEIIKLPENYTEGAPKINEYMQKELDGLQSYSVDLECDFHPQDYSGMCFDNDVIDSINVINDKFLTVDVSSCCAIGGASRAYANNQLIFDLTTGEKLSFKDFFKGSDDDFKKIVKEKYGDESSMEIAEWIVSDGYSHIAYRDDAVVLFATKFDLTGASDSNLVEYEFAYQEMFGTDTLTR